MAKGGFNPRTPAGCDVSTPRVSRISLMFQSTHPCGVRLMLKVTFEF